MARRAKRRRRRGDRQRRRGPVDDARLDVFADVVECGGQLYLAQGFTPAGFPFGPRVEIVDGELRFLDDELRDNNDWQFDEDAQTDMSTWPPERLPF
jgi:hypothetical protein